MGSKTALTKQRRRITGQRCSARSAETTARPLILANRRKRRDAKPWGLNGNGPAGQPGRKISKPREILGRKATGAKVSGFPAFAGQGRYASPAAPQTAGNGGTQSYGSKETATLSQTNENKDHPLNCACAIHKAGFRLRGAAARCAGFRPTGRNRNIRAVSDA